jgi:hypothetical protein
MSSSSVTSATSAATTSSSSTTFQLPSSLKVGGSFKVLLPSLSSLIQIVGIILAVTSGLLIGSSFVFKKKGLLRSQAGHAAGEGVAYLKSVRAIPATPQPVIDICSQSHYGGQA